MPKTSGTIRVSDLRQDAAGALRRVKNSKRALIVTERGKAAGVLLSVRAYERARHEREILRLLARGEREIAAGKGYDLEQVLAEADALLSNG